MVESVVGQGGCGWEGRHKNALFCADDSMIASSDPGCLKAACSTLLGMFDQMGLKTNVGKTVGMVFRPCQVAGTQSKAAYKLQMMGT